MHLLPCDVYDLAETTRAIINCKVMTNLTVASVWNSNISGKWAKPGMQGNGNIISFFDTRSKKVLLLFSKSNDFFPKVKEPY